MISAAFGGREGAPVRFEPCLDVPNGGVLCALPALLANGLLEGAEQLLGAVKGYYTTFHTGIFTSGIISKIDEGKRIAIFYTGRNHAGENIASLYEMRNKEKDPPIQMCDALSRNMSSEFIIILCHCLTHARRSFVEVIESFPDECRYVIEILTKVYHMDAKAKKQNMTPDQRLAFHQTHSGSKMNALRSWLETQFKDKLVEPNSGLGKAITYMIKHWKELTQFLIVPGAPLTTIFASKV
jgi:hypothetical protein